jgi:Leu/Phe-tRNA-protein transferase
MIQQTHGQRLIDIRMHVRQMRRLGVHLIPQGQREQRVQYHYQSQRERQCRARQRRLLPAPATQDFACFTVE